MDTVISVQLNLSDVLIELSNNADQLITHLIKKVEWEEMDMEETDKTQNIKSHLNISVYLIISKINLLNFFEATSSKPPQISLPQNYQLKNWV